MTTATLTRSASVALLERVQQPKRLVVDEDRGIVHGVHIINAGRSLNGRVYSEDLLKRSIDKFEGCPVYEDHAERTGTSRRVADRVGRLVNVRWESRPGGGGLVGDLEAATSHRTWPRLKECAGGKNFLCGLSINGRGNTRRIGGDEQVCDLDISSVDLVSEPSAVPYGLFSESRRHHEQAGVSIGQWLREDTGPAYDPAASMAGAGNLARFAASAPIREGADESLLLNDPEQFVGGGNSRTEIAEKLYTAAKAVLDDKSLSIAERLAKVRKILALAEADRPVFTDEPDLGDLNVTEPTSGVMTKESIQRGRRTGRWLRG